MWKGSLRAIVVIAAWQCPLSEAWDAMQASRRHIAQLLYGQLSLQLRQYAAAAGAVSPIRTSHTSFVINCQGFAHLSFRLCSAAHSQATDQWRIQGLENEAVDRCDRSCESDSPLPLGLLYQHIAARYCCTCTAPRNLLEKSPLSRFHPRRAVELQHSEQCYKSSSTLTCHMLG